MADLQENATHQNGHGPADGIARAGSEPVTGMVQALSSLVSCRPAGTPLFILLNFSLTGSCVKCLLP